MTASKLTIGSRGSPLALAQTQQVKAALEQAHPEMVIHIEVIETTGDRRLDWNLSRVSKEDGTKGLFTKELEEAMLAGTIDCAVHSVKDLPSELHDGLILASVLPRAPSGDLLITREGGYAALPPQAVVATSSVRRHRFLKHLQPEWKFPEIRGNVGTRLRKLAGNEEWHATVLAEAGVHRLGLLDEKGQLVVDDRIWHVDRLDRMGVLPAPGQGIIGIECRDDPAMLSLLQSIEDPQTRIEADFERALLQVLECGCHSPVGVRTSIENGVLVADAVVFWDAEPLPREARMAVPLSGRDDWETAIRKQGGPLFRNAN